MIVEGIVKGDTINLEVSIDEDITSWKIRCEIYDDCGNCIKLATANSGGSNDQIEVTDATAGEFTIKVGKNETTNFNEKSNIEIETENADEELNTPIVGSENFLMMKKEKITWESPDD